MLKGEFGKSQMKKAAAVALSLMMTAGSLAVLPDGAVTDMFSITASAVETDWYEYKGNKFYYSCENGQAVLSKCEVLNKDNVEIPDKILTHSGTYIVNELSNYFGSFMSAKTVKVPDTVRTIGLQVFQNATIDDLYVSNNLQKLGAYFCYNAHVKNAYCFSKVLNDVGDYLFFMNDDGPMNKIIIGNTLVKYDTDKDTLDLTSSEFANITKVYNNAFYFKNKFKTLKIGGNAVLMDPKNYFNNPFWDMETVYYNGKKLICTDKDQVLPDVIAQNDTLVNDSPFGINFAKEKAKCVLNSMGLTYYGENSDFFKGKQSAAYEYKAVRKVHDYMVQNYVYDSDNFGKVSFIKSFTCGTPHVCAQDAMLTAFLLENAGVEAEVVYSGIPTAVSEKDIEKLKSQGVFVESNYQDNKFYRLDNFGNHAWNYVRIGGNWYQLDCTNTRANNFYWVYLRSDEYMKKVNGDNPSAIFGNPHYASLGNAYMKEFQQHNDPMEDVPKCNYTHGDINGDLEINDTDIDMLQAYVSIPDDIREKLLDNKPLNSKEIKIINGTLKPETYIINGEKKTIRTSIILYKDGKFLLKADALDVNFDGVVNIADVVELKRCRLNPKDVRY